MRLIDAEALLKALKSNCGTLCNDKNTDWCEYCCPHNDFEDLIDNAPTVDTTFKEVVAYECGQKSVERPHGNWKFDGWGNYCSECGYRPKLGGGKFCSECGADMRGGHNE